MRLAAAFALTFVANPAQAEFVLALPLGAVETYSAQDEPIAPQVPIGPFADGALPTETGQRPVRRSVWRFSGDQTLSGVEHSIRKQLQASGYDLVLDCSTNSCGGFDFRFGIDVVNPPAMHVDLRDFRFISARLRTTEDPSFTTFLLSRTQAAVFVQMTQYGGATPTTSVPQEVQAPVSQVAVMLEPESQDTPYRFVIEGLEFAAGSTALGNDPQGSLDVLAKVLTDNPDVTAMLVGHSDLSGGLEANIRISKARAEAVRAALIRDHKINPDRLTAHGIGPLSPRADNATEAGKEKNRRVEAVFSLGN